MFEILGLQFMQRAMAGGVITAAALSLLGIFVVLRKSAFFGDAVAHFAFLGIAVGFLANLDPIITAIFISVILAIGIGYIKNKTPSQSLDTIIGIFFSGAVALGIFIIGILQGYRADLFQFLFGDIIAVSENDIYFSLVVALCTVITLLISWKPFFKITFNREIAKVSGTRVEFYDYLFMGLLAVVTSISIKIVGIILVPALLVIPAAAAKNVSRSFKQMAAYSLFFGIISVVFGLASSVYFNVASGATIVLSGIALFILTLFAKK